MTKEEALQKLIELTNRNLRLTPSTPSDFNDVSAKILKKVGHSISLSSLKRLWGYVEYKSFPSPNTLNILARYNGFYDWSDYLERQELPESDEPSEFLGDGVVEADSLEKGDELLVYWENDKSCELEYLCNHRFRVITSYNIKLLADDVFTMHSVCVGLPFYAEAIRRADTVIPGYVGAKGSGVSAVTIRHGKR
jgi:hypothetical protein